MTERGRKIEAIKGWVEDRADLRTAVGALSAATAVVFGAVGGVTGYNIGRHHETTPDSSTGTVEQQLEEYRESVERTVFLQETMDKAGAQLVKSCGNVDEFRCTYTDMAGNVYDLSGLNIQMPDGVSTVTIQSIGDERVSFGVDINNDPQEGVVSTERTWARIEGDKGVDAWISVVNGVYQVGIQYNDGGYASSDEVLNAFDAAKLDGQVMSTIDAIVAGFGYEEGSNSTQVADPVPV